MIFIWKTFFTGVGYLAFLPFLPHLFLLYFPSHLLFRFVCHFIVIRWLLHHASSSVLINQKFILQTSTFISTRVSTFFLKNLIYELLVLANLYNRGTLTISWNVTVPCVAQEISTFCWNFNFFGMIFFNFCLYILSDIILLKWKCIFTSLTSCLSYSTLPSTTPVSFNLPLD